MKKQFLLLMALFLTLSGCGEIEWFPSNSSPNSFSFAAQNNVNINTTVTSESITISGNVYPADISISNGNYSIDGGNYTSAPGKINSGQKVTVQHPSAATANTVTSTVLTIGGVTATFTSTTKTSTAVTQDPTGTLQLQSITVTPTINTTTVDEDIVIEILNTSTTDSYDAKVDYVALDSNGSIVYSGSIQDLLHTEEIWGLQAIITLDLATHAKIVRWEVISIARLAPTL